MDLMGTGCENRVVSLIGLGRVGKFAAPRLTSFGLTVLYTKRTRLSPEEEAALGVEWVDNMDDLIARGDFVSMLANYEPANLKRDGHFRKIELRLPRRPELKVRTRSGYFALGIARRRRTCRQQLQCQRDPNNRHEFSLRGCRRAVKTRLLRGNPRALTASV